MTLSPCLECGTVTDATRCDDCAPARNRDRDQRRGTPAQRGYDSTWSKLSRRARKMQPWCTDCGTEDNLSADHLRWPARSLADVDVVCIPCNSRRGPVRTLRPSGVQPGDQPRPNPTRGETPPRTSPYPSSRQSLGYSPVDDR